MARASQRDTAADTLREAASNATSATKQATRRCRSRILSTGARSRLDAAIMARISDSADVIKRMPRLWRWKYVALRREPGRRIASRFDRKSMGDAGTDTARRYRAARAPRGLARSRQAAVRSVRTNTDSPVAHIDCDRPSNQEESSWVHCLSHPR